MPVTFSQGQFFHPRYGWFDKEPNLPNTAHRSGMIHETIGEEHRIKPGDALYDRVNSSSAMKSLVERMETRAAERAAAEAANPEPAAVYAPRDLSYYLDGTTKFAGSYRFVYKDNTVTAEVDFNPNGTDPMDVVAHYEEHRANILNLKKQGFHDDAVHMLMNALDEAFVGARSGGLETQVTNGPSRYDFDQARAATKALFQAYLDVRGGAGSMQSALNIAGDNLVSRGILNARVDVDAPDSRKVGQPPWMADMIDRLDAAWAASPANQPISKYAFSSEQIASLKSGIGDVSHTHIRNIGRIVDFSNNATMSDIEKEARSLSIVFRVRGNQMIDYAKRYEEIMGQIDGKLEGGDISEADYDRYRADLDTAFIKTHNLNVKGQAMAAGLSEKKATELAMAFSEEYIKIRSQTAPDKIEAGKIANAALQKLTSQGWPQFSLYSSENRATVNSSDPWYAMMSEDALYWQKVPQPYEHW